MTTSQRQKPNKGKRDRPVIGRKRNGAEVAIASPRAEAMNMKTPSIMETVGALKEGIIEIRATTSKV
jgi:hypothetical protein